MVTDFLLKAPIALAPVLIFLAVFHRLDAFKLVSFVTVLIALGVGAVLATASYLVNGHVLDGLPIGFTDYSRYVAPVVEEGLKAGVMIYLFSRNRLGFMVDAAIVGFSIGAGFALLENVYYLYLFPEANIGVWLVRGFGTAVMHGGATAIFGVLAQSLTERHAKLNPALYLPGLAAAIALHAAFNHFPGAPVLTMAVTLLVVPLTLLMIFAKSEHAADKWLLADYKSHEHVLQEIRDGSFAQTEAGRFISDLAKRFDPEVVKDMFAYLQLHTELVVRAEQMLLARENGEILVPTAEDHDKLRRLHGLEKEMGHTALLTLWPHLQFSRKELWELYRLENQARAA
jgi:RsiW-degrading membrane proteinase PrsW (M82 family)